LLTSVAMLTPLLCRIRWAERALDLTNAFRTLVPAGARRGSSVRRGHTPRPAEPHSKPASRPPGLSVIPRSPWGRAQYLTFRPHIPQALAARVRGHLELEAKTQLRPRSSWFAMILACSFRNPQVCDGRNRYIVVTRRARSALRGERA